MLQFGAHRPVCRARFAPGTRGAGQTAWIALLILGRPLAGRAAGKTCRSGRPGRARGWKRERVKEQRLVVGVSGELDVLRPRARGRARVPGRGDRRAPGARRGRRRCPQTARVRGRSPAPGRWRGRWPCGCSCRRRRRSARSSSSRGSRPSLPADNGRGRQDRPFDQLELAHVPCRQHDVPTVRGLGAPARMQPFCSIHRDERSATSPARAAGRRSDGRRR